MLKTPLPLLLAKRELYHGWKHFYVFFLCLVLGITVIATVGLVASTIKSAMTRQSQSLLGGDMEITLRGEAASAAQLKLMESYGKVSHIATLRAMLQTKNGELPALVEVKSIDANYPLMGGLMVNEPIGPQTALQNNGLIVDPNLLTQKNLKLGDTVQLGKASYVIRATLKREPDRIVQLFSFGPRVMLTDESLIRSGLITPFSLVEHHYRIILPDKLQQAELEAKLKTLFPLVPWTIKKRIDGNRTLDRFIEQLVLFLNLAGLTTLLIGGIGIGSAMRGYLAKKSQTIATLKILGGTRRTILLTYIILLAVLSILGSLTGISIALLLATLMMPLLGAWIPVLAVERIVYSLPLLQALGYGILIVYLFSMPVLLSAMDIKPAILFRSKLTVLRLNFSRHVWGTEAILLALFLGFLILSSGDELFTIAAIGMIIGIFLLFGLVTIGVRYVAKRFRVNRSWLRLAIANLHRPGSMTGTTIFAVGISLTVLVALTLTEANFQRRIAVIEDERAPSLFLMDIQPDQQQQIQELLQTAAGHPEDVMVYPMIRGRITALNGKSVSENDVKEDVRWALRGDRGLSYSDVPPPNAAISDGTWWPENYHGKPLVSVDKRFLDGMGLKIGDMITLDVLGKPIEAQIANARKIDYTTFQINFAMMLSPGVLESFPHSYLATVHLPKLDNSETELVKMLAKHFPGITIIRTTEAVELVRGIMDNIAKALRIAVCISLLAGLLVLASALGAMVEQRLYDTAILKVLGASRRDILRIYTVEWILLALITAIIAAIIGTFAAWAIMQRFQGEGFYLMPHITLLTITGCVFVVWLTGYMMNRRIFSMRPAKLLRNE